ncbi:MAG: translational GTPase TypA [Cystobacterineae bacterium]|nr:translational GTPase TypA [Cystobacterineae bacterium]
MISREYIRNVAIVAHVDHGKTTLVDHMLRQAGVFRSNETLVERVMDSGDLEREKGITILAKNTSISYNNHLINIVDTPGHADFGGEVERSLRLVDGVLLLVDAAEGPLPQTRFVLQKALELKLKTVLVINKIDRADARPQEVLDAIYSLYIDLGANDEQIEFPVLYAISRQGIALNNLADEKKNLSPLFEAILKNIPPPNVSDDTELSQMLVTNLDYDDYVGRLAVGRIHSGRFHVNKPLCVMRADGTQQQGKISKVYGFSGLKRAELEDAGPGEIVCIAGMDAISIGDTLSSPDNPVALPRIHVDEPSMKMVFRVSDSPFAGREGKYVTSRNLRERLYREAYKNVAVRVEDSDSPDAFIVYGRGELQFSVILETMRREGYELMASNPEPVLREVEGKIWEPMELVFCDIPESSVGAVTERLGLRKGQLVGMQPQGSDRTRVQYRIPSRGLVGFRSEFLSISRGEGILSSQSDGYEPWVGAIPRRQNGAIVSDRLGKTVPYALFSIQDRGQLFVGPGMDVYEGMVIGEHVHATELNVNPCREKKLTNIRAAGRDENVILTPPREMTLEKILEWISEDELVEITPKTLRIRKRLLEINTRHRAERDRLKLQ